MMEFAPGMAAAHTGPRLFTLTGRPPWGNQMKASILHFLKTNGEQLDAQIAQALRMPMTKVRRHVSQLSASGDVICCQVTRYLDGKKIEGVSCRLAGSLPAPARGPQPGAKQGTRPETNGA